MKAGETPPGGRATRMRRIVIYLVCAIAGLVSGALIGAYLKAGEIYNYQDTVDGVHLPQVDAIICLAGGRGRIGAAGDVWYRYWEISHTHPGAAVPILYISGMGPQSSYRTFERQLRRGVREVIRPQDVVLETESYNTEANARWLEKYAAERGWRKILLMTSPYHMKRAWHIFENVFKRAAIPLEIETLSVFQEPFEGDEWRDQIQSVRVTIWEYIKWLHYRLFWRP